MTSKWSAPKRDPQEAILASIDRALNTFGPTVQAVVYYELKRYYGITPEEIPLKPELFESTIVKIFGIGAATVQRIILKELEVSSGIKDLGEKNFVTAIRTAYHKQLQQPA